MNFDNDKRIINNALKFFLSKYAFYPKEMKEILNYVLFPGGKRIRPILCLEAARLFSETIKPAIPAACAIEIIHNFTLVHDDLPSMDNDNYRRGKLTCHKKFGQGYAVLAGDALLNMAFQVLSDIKNDKISRRLIKVISELIGLRGTIGGQVLDIKHADKNKPKALEDHINYLKTAKLFAASLVSGAISAGAGENKIKRLELFGENFGRAFQIRDDMDDAKKAQMSKFKAQKQELLNRIKKAKSSLDIFGKKSDNLKYIADNLI